MEGQIHKKKENTFFWLFVSPWQSSPTQLNVGIWYLKGDPDRIDPSYSSDKGYLISIIPIGTLAEKRLTYTQLEEDIRYQAYIKPREIRTELKAHLSTREGYLTSAISWDTWGRAEGELTTHRISRIFDFWFAKDALTKLEAHLKAGGGELIFVTPRETLTELEAHLHKLEEDHKNKQLASSLDLRYF